MEHLMEKLEYYLYFFGYAKDERPDFKNDSEHVGQNGTKYRKFDFYDFKGKSKPENQNAYMDYLNINEKMLNMRINEK